MSDKKPAKRIYTLAAAVGLALGAMGIASAASAPAQPAPVVGQTQVESPSVTPDDESSEAEGVDSDEAIDGVDHQFEGEEVGNNGDGIPDPNEANEVDDAEDDDASEVNEAEEADDDASEVEGADTDEADDGVDHQFEGEEVGNNGDGIPDADDAGEAANG